MEEEKALGSEEINADENQVENNETPAEVNSESSAIESTATETIGEMNNEAVSEAADYVNAEAISQTVDSVNTGANVSEGGVAVAAAVTQNTEYVNPAVQPVYQNGYVQNFNPAMAAPKKSKAPLIIGITAIVVVLIGISVAICMFFFDMITNKSVGEIEDQILSLSSNVYDCEDEIISAYKAYEGLSADAKRKVQNREKLIDLYKQLEAIINNRIELAAQVDELIEHIDYSNIYAQATTVKKAVIAYNDLDEKTKEYLKNEDAIFNAYGQVENLNVTVTKDNFYDLFNISYSVGERSNFGSGISVDHNGYDIYIDEYGGSVTPNYDINAHNDYATPVYIYVQAKYPALTSSCKFGIDLHQTYNGLGIIDSDVHEFELQQGTINYKSSMSIGEYVIMVENNDAGSGILDWFGLSYDWSDMTHDMNPFDKSRVEIYNISGSVTY